MAGAKTFVEDKIRQRKVMMFTKRGLAECERAKGILDTYKMPRDVYEVCEIDSRQDCTQIENYFQIICLTDNRYVPRLFVDREYVGGEIDIPRLEESGELRKILSTAGAFHES